MLKSKRISDSHHFLEATGSPEKEARLSGTTGIPENRITEIRCLCDLARITGIGPKTCRGFYEAGIRSVRQLAGENSASLMGKIRGLSRARYGIMKDLGINNMNEVIRCAEIIAGSDPKP